MGRVCVIGLDCLTPQLAFGAFAGSMPNLQRLAKAGMAGMMRSSMPPITVPAWSVMVTGLDPGALGVYGFHDRARHDYTSRRLASSLSFAAPTLWTLASRAGLTSRVIGVPQSYPPKPLKGALVTGMLTPRGATSVAYPPELCDEVLAAAGEAFFDVPDFRSMERTRLIATIRDATHQHFALARDWLARPDWDLFMMVEMGPDRMHHAFWRYSAPDHPGYVPGHPLEHAIRDYYALLDAELGTVLGLLRDDDVVLVVSDHGARTSRGGFALNDWLISRGYLSMQQPPGEPRPLTPNAVDWRRSRAWADGGYVGRIHLNVTGREPEGVVAPDQVEALARELIAGLREVRLPSGGVIRAQAWRPSELYATARGIPPDLTVCLDDFAYRAVASVGNPDLLVEQNDTGPDDANHAPHGVLVLCDGAGPRATPPALDILDVAPTVLRHLGIERSAAMSGRVL